MSLNFAAIAPHPPIIVPEVGQKEDKIKTALTIQAMKKLGFAFNRAEIDTLIVVSPHTLSYPDQFSIIGMKKLFGSFLEFGSPETILEFQNDLEFAHDLHEKAERDNIPTLLYDNGAEFFEMDNGLMVPLYYLRATQESSFKVVPIAYSGLDRGSHFAFGQTIKEVAKNYPGRVGILASGDLSHQLIQRPETKQFDEILIKDIKENKTENILYYDDEMVDNWFECGYRSILVLLGALDGQNSQPEVFSYEGPFGIGYLVADFKLPE